ncbi:uncharacterized protein LOC121731885 [Aricia agestis]|uniref:uncharacterized protein LOC121731885 n=1 Tax=Aricia agestis TaxID=91739 RepID=UPI001C20B2F4|nr:uncharacterized protein LOC121731885 [Aricia agestis]
MFNLYVDSLIEELSSTHVGCHIDGVNVNNLSYADDMVLLSASICGLNKLLKICEKFAMLLALPRYCSASGMFADARVDCFYTTMRKRCTSLARRVRGSDNTILKVLANSETWTLTQKEETKLLVAERKILRKILGPTRDEDGSWRPRKNLEIEELVAMPNIIGEYKSHRIRWLDHVERMNDDRAAKKAYVGQMTGKRPVGRPRYRWRDEVEKDLKAL